ncbi:MAG: hypothetical protein COU06_02750 [Candidatus Harrisonbacteria bacterium CG10_big_fil_rev_8_21_14_0_10_38_8]|uniref:Uncharacterized protein n=1 Tax=Candidatus Harrisonbacteria bacterium CG10_big_fil_rev_8_21_14_0_10_38_8 TaxID=1974582 RepID=A0A2M6WJE4_9BACT|nr:MAG: hypothetical protein COU06_02750 [Candidatus Harrisonbacteria bacterium CG10_big_fil_rev_8_21_14_0_10_38_8]
MKTLLRIELITILILSLTLFKAPAVNKDIVIHIPWGNIGEEVVTSEIFDLDKIRNQKELLNLITHSPKSLELNQDTSKDILTLLWAFGLINNNPILTNGPINSPEYGGSHVFASTGGWNLSKESSMNHFNMHKIVSLTKNQQERLEEVSKIIYRPCCNNSTYFPDCNHGMAMLGLLEILISQDISEIELYETVYIANKLWFPDHYQSLPLSIQKKSPKELLSKEYISASGWQKHRVQNANSQSC